MNMTTFRNEKELLEIHYDTEATEPATRFVIWFEGLNTVIVANDGELSDALWERVLEQVRNMRHSFRDADHRDPHHLVSGYHRGNPWRTAHIYCGIEPTQEQVAAHMKQWIEWMLWQISNPWRNDNGDERVAALCALADLYGFTEPQKVRAELPQHLLELVEKELARRKTKS